MVLVQLLLPTRIPEAGGTRDAMAALRDTRRELAEVFDGLTAYMQSPATGLWTAADGRKEQDGMIMVEVVTDTFDRAWWRSYTMVLTKRFAQTEIHVRALEVQMLDVEE